MLNSNTSSTCPDNTMNFGPLAAEICWRFWGTSANFNRFRILAALYCTALQYWASAKLCGVEQRTPPIFGRAAITLAHILVDSRLVLFSTFFRSCNPRVSLLHLDLCGSGRWDSSRKTGWREKSYRNYFSVQRLLLLEDIQQCLNVK